MKLAHVKPFFFQMNRKSFFFNMEFKRLLFCLVFGKFLLVSLLALIACQMCCWTGLCVSKPKMLLAIKLVDLCETFVHIKEKKKVIDSNLLTEIFNLYLLFLKV